MDESQETFLSHLIELRDRLIKCLVAVGIAFIPAFIFSNAEAGGLLHLNSNERSL